MSLTSTSESVEALMSELRNRVFFLLLLRVFLVYFLLYFFDYFLLVPFFFSSVFTSYYIWMFSNP